MHMASECEYEMVTYGYVLSIDHVGILDECTIKTVKKRMIYT